MDIVTLQNSYVLRVLVTKILSVAQMRRVEEECAKIGLPQSVLMENAGKAVAEGVREILGVISQQSILILIGPGHNGGDGLVAARHLHDWGAEVNLYFLSQRPLDDSNLQLVRERHLTCIEVTQDENLSRLDELLTSTNVVVDAIFGTGRSRPLRDVFAQALNKVSGAKRRQPALRIIALDLPSGLDADSGAVDAACLYTDYTITLGFPKRGLINPPGAERGGLLAPGALPEETGAVA